MREARRRTRRIRGTAGAVRDGAEGGAPRYAVLETGPGKGQRWSEQTRVPPPIRVVVLVVGVNGTGKTTTSASSRRNNCARERKVGGARRRRHLPALPPSSS